MVSVKKGCVIYMNDKVKQSSTEVSWKTVKETITSESIQDVGVSESLYEEVYLPILKSLNNRLLKSGIRIAFVRTTPKINLWCEGYAATGQSSKATFCGEFEAVDLKDAVRQYKKSRYDTNVIDVENLTEWGCRFFDNEADARRSYG